MSQEASRLRNIRAIYSKRGDARTRSDIAFLLYAGLLLFAISVFPLFRALIIVLMDPGVTAALIAPDASGVVTLSCGALLAGMLLLGRVRGPVAPSRFFTTLLAVNDMRRSRSLRRPFVLSGLIVVAAIVIAWLILGGVLLVSDPFLLTGVLGALLAWLCMGLWASVLWLAGQSLRSVQVWFCVLGIVILTSVACIFPALWYFLPWAWIGATWPTAIPSVHWVLLPILLVTTGSVMFVPKLLNRITSMELLESGKTWESVGAAVLSGDISAALGNFRSRPRRGRGWEAVRGRSVLVQTLSSDLIGAMRSPGRFAVGVLAVISGITLIGFSLPLEVGIAWLLSSAGAVIVYLGLGAFADGFRHSSEATATVPLYGSSTLRMYLMHALLPAFITLIAIGIAALVLLYTVSSHSWIPHSWILGVSPLTAIIVLFRAFDSAKGNLPLILQTPIPSPVGDPSALFVLAWNADAVLLSLFTGGLIGYLFASGLLLYTAVALLLIGAVVAHLLRRRLSSQR